MAIASLGLTSQACWYILIERPRLQYFTLAEGAVMFWRITLPNPPTRYPPYAR